MYAFIFIIQQMSIISVHLINHHKNNYVKWTIIKDFILRERERFDEEIKFFSLSVSVISFITKSVKENQKFQIYCHV